MQLRIHEHLQDGQERSIRTFEHFLGHFFSRYMPLEGWSMEVWLVEDDTQEDELKPSSRFNCGIVLSKPGEESICAQKISSNLSGAIFYAIKSIHRDFVKLFKLQNKVDEVPTRGVN